MSRITWIASYPRSGDTWTRFMLTSYLMNIALNHQETVEELIPDFHDVVQAGRVRDLIRMGTTMPSYDAIPLLVKTHYLPSTEIMRQCGPVTANALYIVRNPRDVLLSAARYGEITPSRDERSREWARNFIAKRGDVSWPGLTGSWSQNVHEWTSLPTLRQHLPGIRLLVLRYEDMRSDPAGKLNEIIGFLNPDAAIDKDRVLAAAENSSMERMRELENKVFARHEARDPGFSAKNHRRFVGQGLHNQSLAIFGEDIEAEYERVAAEDSEFAACVKQFGYAS